MTSKTATLTIGGTDKLVTAWIPIGDIPVAMGGLAYLEGSHAFGRAMERDFSEANAHLAAAERIGAYNKSMNDNGWITKDLPAQGPIGGVEQFKSVPLMVFAADRPQVLAQLQRRGRVAVGQGLPPGSGSVQEGRALFAEKCASCHGDKGEGGIGDRLVGGQGTIATAKAIRTVGSFWPYAPTLFDYIRRAMPQNAPQSLSNEDVYAVSAYILNLNGLVDADATLDAKSLAAIKMPNRDKFVGDARPDVK